MREEHGALLPPIIHSVDARSGVFLFSEVITMRDKTVRNLTVTAVLSAVAFVLMLLDFSVPIMPSFPRNLANEIINVKTTSFSYNK